MTDVFISYSRKDTDFVRRLFNELQTRGREAWVDWQGIDYSTRWWEEICAGVEGADNFVLMVSPDALNSVYCHREIEHARRHNKRIIPFVFRALNEKEIVGGWYTLPEMRPYEALARENWETIKAIQWIDYPNPTKLDHNFDRAVDILLTTVDTDPERARLHTRLLLRIRDWEGRGRSPSALLRGDELAAYESWLAATDAAGDEPRATDEQRTYISESRRVEEEERHAEARRKQELLEAAQRADDERKKADQAALQAQRLRQGAVIAGILSLIVIGLGIWTIRDAQGRTDEANQARADAEVRIAEAATQIAAQQAIAPGATRSVVLMDVVQQLTTLLPTEAVATYLPGWQPVEHNVNWTPILRQIAGAEMVLVPTGCFDMGTDHPSSRSIEQPLHEQCVEIPFWIDRYEVTNTLYESLLDAVSFAGQTREPDQPRNNVTWLEARDFCALRGARLPTELEWEYAARGLDSLDYVWGNDYAESFAPPNSEQPAAVGSLPSDVSWVGAVDMSANVSEWVSSLYAPYPYQADIAREDLTREDDRVARGGSYAGLGGRGSFGYDFSMLAAIRGPSTPTDRFANRGFRCARSF